jgi:bifunctional non-homologous end joining protein LigD
LWIAATGGKGLHVVVPVRPTLTWSQAKAFAKGVADPFARTFPNRFVSVVSKSKRKGKIFIDYVRNSEGATAIAPYGIRARKNAPVSTPIEWDEFTKDVRFRLLQCQDCAQAAANIAKDPWTDFITMRQTITAAMFRQLGIPKHIS